MSYIRDILSVAGALCMCNTFWIYMTTKPEIKHPYSQRLGGLMLEAKPFPFVFFSGEESKFELLQKFSEGFNSNTHEPRDILSREWKLGTIMNNDVFGSDLFVLLATPNYFQEKICELEVLAAIHFKIRILVILDTISEKEVREKLSHIAKIEAVFEDFVTMSDAEKALNSLHFS